MPVPVRVEEAARNFKEGYKRKSPHDRQAVDAAIVQMAEDLSYPSLRVSKMSGKKDVWEARASQSVRLTFEFVSPGAIRLRSCCTHDQAYRV
jgi:hypothetical protein